MKFRVKAFSVHLLISACILVVVLAALHFGWYHWPGWYIVGALKIAAVMAMVDVGLGPFATLIVANPAKPRGEFRRDISIIAVIQLAALVYGAATLWGGRPLFYTFSVDRVEVVQASTIDDDEIELARKENPTFVPSWTSLPQWVWVPLPSDEAERVRIIESAMTNGKDVIGMPRYFKPWEQGADDLRVQLKEIGQLRGFSKVELAWLQNQMSELGGAPSQFGAVPFDGRGAQAVAAFDRSTLELKAIWKVER